MTQSVIYYCVKMLLIGSLDTVTLDISNACKLKNANTGISDSNNTRIMFMVAEQRQMAADLWTKPTDLSRWPACKQHVTTSTVDIYYYLETMCGGLCS